MREQLTIEKDSRGATYRNKGYTVYRLDTYPRSSVLAGQQRRTWLENFETLEAAQAKYPAARLIPGTSYQPPDLSHLRDDEDY